MKKGFILLIALLMVKSTLSQIDKPCLSCLPHGITFSTQTQIDNFQANYPDCKQIEGDVTINGTSIKNLSGLSALTSFGGDLVIEYCQALQNLKGLDSVASITGSLEITDCNALTSLTGLDKVSSIGSLRILNCNALTSLAALHNVTSLKNNLIIFSCPSLTSLTGLESVTSIGGLFKIEYTDLTSLKALEKVTSIGGGIEIYSCSLTSLTGLNGLTSIGGGLTIDFCSSLTSLLGLESLTSIGEELFITNCSTLTSLTGLDNVTSIGGSLYIYNCNGLTTMKGLDKLRFTGEVISILNCNGLTSLSGLDNMDAVKIKKIEIHDNYSLSTCEVKSICNFLWKPDAITDIYDNALGCSSQEEVEDSCHAIGIEFLILEPLLNLYPNPTSTNINIETPTQGSISILDINGQKLLQKEITKPNTNVDISILPSGIYLVKIAGTKVLQIVKFVKK